ncbi:hypothetical protein RND81_07G100500 [Saponaria officinalis]|uniref:Endonuclease/exonuclease/phosphatase domain-containing protein n=1 Tax=Saponaria officinalis TaxID=3572 RepID=A0AAW1JNP9_SAPOF
MYHLILMRIATWNIRGFNDALKHQEVRQLLDDNKIDIFGLIETRVKEPNANKIFRIHFPDFSFLNNYSTHYNGRIWFMYKPSTITVLSSVSHGQFIHYKVLHHATQVTLDVTVSYGCNAAGDRITLWSNLVMLSRNVSNWITIGDFNIVRGIHERLGPNPPNLADMLDFNGCIMDCGLEDLRTSGGEFTWTNKHKDGTRVWSRLDRALVNQVWLNSFPNSGVIVELPGVSDHSPLMVNVLADIKFQSRFSFLNCWISYPRYNKVVEECWKGTFHGTEIFKFFCKLKAVRRGLLGLHKDHFGGLTARVAVALQELRDCQSRLQKDYLNIHIQEQEETLLSHYQKLEKAELQMMHQRTKLQDIKWNDCSSTYFYAKLVVRRNQSIVGQITDMAGNQVYGVENVNNAFVDFYKDLLGRSMKVQALNAHFISSTGPCLLSRDDAPQVSQLRRAN